jgi:hypothetical protein
VSSRLGHSKIANSNGPLILGIDATAATTSATPPPAPITPPPPPIAQALPPPPTLTAPHLVPPSPAFLSPSSSSSDATQPLLCHTPAPPVELRCSGSSTQTRRHGSGENGWLCPCSNFASPGSQGQEWVTSIGHLRFSPCYSVHLDPFLNLRSPLEIASPTYRFEISVGNSLININFHQLVVRKQMKDEINYHFHQPCYIPRGPTPSDSQTSTRAVMAALAEGCDEE